MKSESRTLQALMAILIVGIIITSIVLAKMPRQREILMVIADEQGHVT